MTALIIIVGGLIVLGGAALIMSGANDLEGPV